MKLIIFLFVCCIISMIVDRQLSGKIVRALKPGGVYIVQDFIRYHTQKKEDHLGALLDLYFAVTSQSDTWSVEEISSWQQEAGLVPKKPVWQLTIPRHAQVVAMKPK